MVKIGGPHVSLHLLFPPARVSVSSTIIAPPLDAATHILIETLLIQGFENKLIALKATVVVALYDTFDLHDIPRYKISF